MNFQRPVTATITIGDQPTVADLEKLKQEGYVGVVNLRNDGEPDQPLSTSEEGNQVRALGMKYLHYGVGAAPLSEAGVTAVCDFVDANAQGTDKVLVHCRRGPRAIALLLLQQARQSLGRRGGLREGEGTGTGSRRRSQDAGRELSFFIERVVEPELSRVRKSCEE